jgi:hypothetical protein
MRLDAERERTAQAMANRVTPIVLSRLRKEGVLKVRSERRVRELTRQEIRRHFLTRAGRRFGRQSEADR